MKISSDNNNEDIRSPSLWVWVAALCSLMGAASMGAVLGWTAPGLPDMAKGDSNPQLTKDDVEVKTWIGSIMTLGALFGGLLGGPTFQMLGAKKSLIGLGAPFVLGWVLICSAKSFWLILIGRVFCGFAAGICCGVVPTYCIQISTPNIRGLLGTGFQIFVTIGVLYVDIFGLVWGWRVLCIVGLIPAVLMSVGMLFMPESPAYLMNKFGRTSQVVDSLRKLRKNDIELELKELEERADNAKEGSGFSMNLFLRADIYKPFIIANCLMFFQQFSGINAVLFYSSDIFADSGSSMEPMQSTCMVTAAMVVATIGGGLIIDKLGRKILLLISGIGHTITLAVMGYYYYSKRNDPKPSTDTTTLATIATSITSIGSSEATTIATAISTSAPDSNSLGWLPVVCLVLFVVFFSIGFGPIPWMIVAEITPGVAIGLISSIGTGVNWLSAFIVTKEFEAMQKAITPYGTFWLFAGICAASVVFVFLFVPESKGKSVEEMQRIFLGTNNSEQVFSKSVNKDVSTV